MIRKLSRAQMAAGLLLAALVLLSLPAVAGAQGAPDFSLKDAVSGQTYSLQQFRGKVVVLNFYTFLCEPCKLEMPALNQIQSEFGGQVQVLGIGLDSTAEQLRSLAQEKGTTYPVLVAPLEVAKAYGDIQIVPTTVIIDRNGNITKSVTGAQTEEQFAKMIRSAR